MKISTTIKKIIPFKVGVKIRGFSQKIMALYYKGDKYTCPYCKKSFRKMLAGGFDLPVIKEKNIIGGGYRKNLVCPRCYSTDRDRLIYWYFKNKTDIFVKKSKLLHIAPEGCLKALLSSHENIDYFTGDKFTKGYDAYYYDRDVIQLDVKNIPYKDNEFDIIICNHVLEHIKDGKKALSEIYRVLKPNAWAMLQVPISSKLDKTFQDDNINTPEDREKYYGQFDHVKIYGKDYIEILEDAGFKVKLYKPLGDIFDSADEMKKYSVNPEENIYIAYKS